MPGRNLQDFPGSCASHLLKQFLDFAGDFREFGIDGVELAWRIVGVEVAIEGDLVTDAADAAVLVVALGFIDPGERDMRRDLAGEVFADVFAERDVLVVAEVGIRFDVAFGVLADLRVVVMFAEVLGEEFGGRGGEREGGRLEDGFEILQEAGAGKVGFLERVEGGEQDRLLVGIEFLPCGFGSKRSWSGRSTVMRR